MGNDGNKCLAGEGCSPVIAMAKEIEVFFSKAKQSMENHTKESLAYWENQREITTRQQKAIDSVMKTFHRAALMFSEGSHRMKKIEGDVDNLAEEQRKIKFSIEQDLEEHESGEYGAHTTIKKHFNFVWWGGAIIIIWLSVVSTFIAIQHPNFFKAIGYKIGIS